MALFQNNQINIGFINIQSIKIYFKNHFNIYLKPISAFAWSSVIIVLISLITTLAITPVRQHIFTTKLTLPEWSILLTIILFILVILLSAFIFVAWRASKTSPKTTTATNTKPILFKAFDLAWDEDLNYYCDDHLCNVQYFIDSDEHGYNCPHCLFFRPTYKHFSYYHKNTRPISFLKKLAADKLEKYKANIL